MIDEIVKPETDLEKKILSDEDFRKGITWGKPRKGHPEGQVMYHIGHVLKNVDLYSTPGNREKLRLISIIHDSFKYKVDSTKPKNGDNHHAVIARRFTEKYSTDTELLEIIELHDEAYNAWCLGDRDGKWEQAESRAKKLIERLGESLELYLIF